MKIVYSLKKDEVLIENQDGQFEDFAENLWSPKDKYFKDMFLPVYTISNSKKSKKKPAKRTQV